jgi:hypothetical protein
VWIHPGLPERGVLHAGTGRDHLPGAMRQLDQQLRATSAMYGVFGGSSVFG